MLDDNNTFLRKLEKNLYVYHYTSVDALFSILEKCRKNEQHTSPFLAGCVYNSNDPREIDYSDNYITN